MSYYIIQNLCLGLKVSNLMTADRVAAFRFGTSHMIQYTDKLNLSDIRDI